MVEYIKTLGYKENEIEYVTGEGASAIKLNDKYIEMLNEIKQHIQNGIKAVAVWHLNRLGRNDVILTEFKNYFIEHKVQLYCKEPSLKLLNDDGTVNTGAELAYGLFSVMVKQDMMEKMAKFKRSKRYKMESGIWVGGNIKFGYYVNENNEVKEKVDDANIVRLIYDLYSTGEYSFKSLRDELIERGYTSRNNFRIGVVQIGKILSDKSYIGIRENGYLTYPAIVNEDIFKTCEEIRKNNNTAIDKSKRYCLGNKIIKCKECGGKYTADDKYYSCYYNRKGRYDNVGRKCDNNLTIDINVIDSILWHYAASYHMDYLLNLNEDNINGYKDELAVIDSKIKETSSQIEKINKRKERVMTSFFNDEIDSKTKDNWLGKINNELTEYTNKLKSFKDSKNRLKTVIEKTKNDIDSIINHEASIRYDVMEMQNRKEMYKIVHQHIKVVYLEKSSIAVDNKYYKATKITIEGYNGNVEALYFAHHKFTPYKLFNSNGKKVVIDRIQPNGGIYKDRVYVI